MITPRFRLRQDANFIYIVVELPYVKISEVEVDVESAQFTMYVKPYFLKLTFGHDLRDDEQSKGVYDIERKEITFKVSKAQPGTEFEDLDLVASLLSPKKPRDRGFIEVVSGQEDQEEGGMPSDRCYGFNRRFQHFFEQQQEAQYELLDFDPDVYPVPARAQVALEREQEDFELDRYLTDLDEEAITQTLSSPTEELYRALLPSIEEQMSALQLDAAVRLGSRELLVSTAMLPCLFHQCFDVLFAFCYEFRSMEGELTCESAWGINKLSATLSCMLEFPDLPTVLTSCFRRALVYPLYRSEALAQAALNDARRLVADGKGAMLRALLAVKHAFERSEPRYLLNRLFIDDASVWVQRVETGHFRAFQTAVGGLQCPSLEELGLSFTVQ